MSGPEVLIFRVVSLGARLEARGASLHVEAPRPLPDELMEALRQHKAEVLSLLALPEEARPLVAWAAWLAERVPGDDAEIRFRETPQRSVRLRLSELGRYITSLLADLTRLQSWEAATAPDTWPESAPGWRRQQIEELCSALASLREALRPLGLAEIKELAT